MFFEKYIVFLGEIRYSIDRFHATDGERFLPGGEIRDRAGRLWEHPQGAWGYESEPAVWVTICLVARKSVFIVSGQSRTNSKYNKTGK